MNSVSRPCIVTESRLPERPDSGPGARERMSTMSNKSWSARLREKSERKASGGDHGAFGSLAEAVVQAEAPSELRAACQRVVHQPNESVGLGVGLPDGERIVQEIPVDRVRLSRRDVDAVFTRLSRDAAVQITLPRRDTIKDAAHDWLWLVRKDELDVPRLVKLKVEEGGSAMPGEKDMHERKAGSEES